MQRKRPGPLTTLNFYVPPAYRAEATRCPPASAAADVHAGRACV